MGATGVRYYGTVASSDLISFELRKKKASPSMDVNVMNKVDRIIYVVKIAGSWDLILYYCIKKIKNDCAQF